ncbi:uncharacterized protein LOC134535624 [Bacillus rossius redtenbacheri]|uniref:uncharacterized protein LOC134535624 n=1 Tax=Bacillus rossius redtenbacheri TaxID=93214 RepID=UPI002FDD6B46
MESDTNPSCSSSESSVSAKKRKYLQKYNVSWESNPAFTGWLSISKKGEGYAYCKACMCDLSASAAGKVEIEKHSKGKKHLTNVTAVSKQHTLLDMPSMNKKIKLETQVKEGEIRLAAFLAEHNLPFNIMEHLPQLIKSVCPDSTVASHLVCKRTKATAIVKNVTGKISSQNLNKVLQENKFSIIVDESTDKGCIKHLCIVARTVKDCTVSDAFFGLIPVQDASAESLYRHITNALNDAGIAYKDNMVGLACDGANVMTGKHNSLSTRLIQDIPNLFVMKCVQGSTVCHSFHLCASYACMKLPRAVEDLARDVYNYFQSSPKRISSFVEFQVFVNIKPHKMLHPAQTRWLSLQAVVVRLLEQYEALKLFFTNAVITDRLQAAETILNMLNDPVQKLYLAFLDFVLELFNKLNKQMQAEKPQIHLLYASVSSVVHTLLDCFISEDHLKSTAIEDVQFKNPKYFLPLENMYLGAKVNSLLAKGMAGLTKEALHGFRIRCLEFFIEAASQIYKRFDFGNVLLKEFEILDPKCVIQKKLRSIAHLACKFPNIVADDMIQSLDTEWRLLRNHEFTFDENISTEEFWLYVKNLKTGDGSPMFPNLIAFIEALLCLPHSSATVERIFSTVNIMKPNQRNSLSTETLIGLLHTKRMLSNSNCFEFPVTGELLNEMTASMYETKKMN